MFICIYRDIKVNTYQHGENKIKKKCEIYLEMYASKDIHFDPNNKKKNNNNLVVKQRKARRR